jgi:hypothetical protein
MSNYLKKYYMRRGAENEKRRRKEKSVGKNAEM